MRVHARDVLFRPRETLDHHWAAQIMETGTTKASFDRAGLAWIRGANPATGGSDPRRVG